MTNFVHRVTKAQKGQIDYPLFQSGDTVEVHVKVREGEKERIQKFKGVVIKIQGAQNARSFTVRKMSSGIGVERTFPFASPTIDKVDLISRGKVRRSRLYYLRNLFGKKARIASTLVSAAENKSQKELAKEATEAK